MIKKIKELIGASERNVEVPDFDSLHAEVDSLPLEEVKRFILQEVMGEGRQYVEVVPASSKKELDLVSKSNFDFYKLFDELSVVKSDLFFSLDEIAPSEFLKDYVCVGRDIGFSEVVSKKNGQKVFFVDFDESNNVILDQKMKSIWHYLLMNLFTVYPDLYVKFNEYLGSRGRAI